MKRFFEGMLCGFLNGFFGSGGGVAAVPVLEHEQRGAGNTPAESVRRAHANSVAVIFVLSAVAAVSYFFSGGIDFGAAWGYIPWVRQARQPERCFSGRYAQRGSSGFSEC